MQLQHFACYSDIFQERFMNPLWEKYPQHDSDIWDSLCLFLEGYAFERQGRRPDYGHVAVDSLMKAKNIGGTLKREHISAVWKNFKDILNGSGLNEANNPLCPKGYDYKVKKGKETVTRTTAKHSVLEFLLHRVKHELSQNIVMYAKAELNNDKLQEIHNKMQEMNGIGPKIASLFLRDVAIIYDIHPSKDRNLLQPIDIWVRRIVKELGDPEIKTSDQDSKVDKEISEWIVDKSVKVSVNPERVNQGMWYFATQITGSYHRLKNSIKNANYAKELLIQHKQTLENAANAINSLLH